MRSMMGEMRDRWVQPKKYSVALTYPTASRRAPFLSRFAGEDVMPACMLS